MRARAAGLIVVAVLAAGCSGQAGPARPPSPSAGPFDWRSCSLGHTLINTSHLVDVDLSGDTRTVEFYDGGETGFFGRSARDQVPIYFYDVIDSTVTSLRHTRSNDPRAPQFGELSPGTKVTMAHRTNPASGELFDHAMGSATVAVGQFERGTEREWLVHAAMVVEQDESIRFQGDCGPELDRQLSVFAAALIDGRAVTDLDVVRQLIDGALSPGRGGDFRYLETPEDRRFFDGFMEFVIPQILDGKTRRVTWVLTSRGEMPAADPEEGPALVGLRSAIGSSGMVNPAAQSGEMVDAIVAIDGPIEVWTVDTSGVAQSRIASLSAAESSTAASLRVVVDGLDGTASIEVAVECCGNDQEPEPPIAVDLGVPTVAFVD